MATIRMRADQKKGILLDVIRESRSFFKLQELEAIGSKRGIVVNTIKEMVQHLVDEGLVMSEKVGSFQLYWSFPSTDIQKKLLRCTSLKNECEEMRREIARKQTIVESERNSKEYTEERKDLEKRFGILKKIDEEQRRELAEFSETDPTVYDRLVAERGAMVEEGNRVTDNIFVVQDYICSRFSMEKSEVASSFNIPQDLDYMQ